MRKKIQRILVGFIATCVMVLSVGCGNSFVGDEEKADAAKTQLYVYNFNGGIGEKWLQDVKTRFEKAYADYKGANDKIGVQVIIENGKTNGLEFETSLAGSRYDVVFTEGVQYYDFVNQGLLYDLTDALTTELTEAGESQSVFDKFTEEQKDYYKTDDGKIYAVPYRFDAQGIIYDLDLFKEYFLYYAKGGCPSEYSTFTQNNNDDPAVGSFEEYIYTDGSQNGNLSAGPDGLYGTSDDGLPATYDEFFALCEEMTSYGITPFIWTGQYRENYLKRNFSSMVVDYEGLENYSLRYKFDGVATHLVDTISDDGKITYMPATTITEDNGYLMYRSAGTYYASLFFEKLIKGGYYHENCFALTSTHQDAQSDYLYSKYTSNRIAFLMDGIWWENEADASFAELEKKYDDAGQMDRNFGLLPMPKATEEQIGEPETYCDFLKSLCMVNANVSEDKKELAELFVRFCFTEESNRNFNIETGVPRSLSYNMSDSDLSKLSTFGKMVYEKSRGDIAYPFANTALYRRLQDVIYDVITPQTMSSGTVWEAFKYYPDESSSVTFFKENMDLLKSHWE